MYPVSFREIALRLYDYFQSLRKTASIMKICYSSISRWCKNIQPKSRKTRKTTIITDPLISFIQSLLLNNPSLNCKQLVSKVKETFNVSLSRQLIHNIVKKRLHFSFKRIRKRGKSPKKDSLIQDFKSTILHLKNQFPSSTVYSIDESGFDHRVVPCYGYAPLGKPAILEYTPAVDKKRYTLLMSIGNDGSHYYKVVDKRFNFFFHTSSDTFFLFFILFHLLNTYYF